jgi:hypothetical protein
MARLLARPRLASFALFALLAVGHTWPLATDPAHLSRNDNADTVLNEWTIAWVAHRVPTSPLHLFDANIFYPDRNTLAYSEHLFVPAMMGAPLLWLGGSPVLAYNILLLAGLTLTGWSTSLLIWRWTDNWTAGLVAGVLAAFNAHTLTRLPHLQALHAEFLPTALLALDLLLSAPRPRTALQLSLWFVLQALTSYYLLVFTAVALAVGCAVRPEDWWGAQARRLLPLLLLAGAIALVCVLPFLLPYWRLGTVRTLDEVAYYGATWRNYLSTPARVHYGTWSFRWFGGSAALFPGLSGLVLAAIAVVSGTAFSDRRARMALAFGAVGMVLSFGPAIPGYATLYYLVPALQGIRNVARFGYLTIVAVAVLAGFGLALVSRRWQQARWLPTAVAAAIVAVNVDTFVAPVGYVRADPILPLYKRLLKAPGTVVVEFPFYPPDRTFFNAPYLLNSTRHWRPILNGYSGLVPASYEAHYRDLRGFPDEHAIATLRNAGVTDVVVHEVELRARSGEDAANAVRLSNDLQLVERDGSVSLYRLVAR